MHKLVVLFTAGVSLAILRSAESATITLDSGSNLTATAGVTFDVQQDVAPVTTVPYVTPDTITHDGSTGTVTPTVNSEGFGFTDSDVATLNTGLIEDSADIYFTPGPGTVYSLFGSSTEANSQATRTFDVLLEDDTTGQRLYADDLGSGGGGPAGTLTIDPNRAGYSGVLTAGDEYDFYFASDLSDNQSTPESQLANVGISFAVPEPAVAGTMVVVGIVLLLGRRRPLRTGNNAGINWIS